MITAWLNEYAFLSNFYPCRVEFEGIWWPSSEHAYVAMKFYGTPSWDRNVRFILGTQGPEKVKKFGRKAKQLVESRADWIQDSVRIEVMEAILRKKFQGELLEKLVQTGSEVLEHSNSWKDTFWGTCIKNGKKTGSNHLGKILMKIRDEGRNC